MSSSLESVIQLGEDISAFKYYILANCVVLVYDYFLTLEDEVKYAWSGKKSWTFWVFLANRYLPIAWLIWPLIVQYGPRSRVTMEICERTSYYPCIIWVFFTFIAQSVLTVRMYAVTTKNIAITICFAVIAVAQCAVGISMTVLISMNGAQPQLPIPFDAYHLCVFYQPPRGLEIAYTSISLFYDSLAFLLVTLRARRFKATSSLNFPTILDTIAEDATWYFMLIFGSHFVLVLTLNLGRPTIQLIPGAGVIVYFPVMVSRIMLSLKKAGHSTKTWGITELTTHGASTQNTWRLAPPQMNKGGRGKGDVIPLDMFLDS